MQNVIEIKDLRKSYKLNKPRDGKDAFEAVKGVSFTVRKGEIFGILGPNGAGKTTTLEIIEGLKKQSSGTVTVLGFDNIQGSDEIKKRIGVQLQSSDYLPALTLGELLDLFASLYPDTVSSRANPNASEDESRDPLHKEKGFPHSDTPPAGGLRNDIKKHLLKLVNLEDKEHELVKNLSGGQKQRFSIATTLVNNPEIIFLDEPTTGLDPAARRSLWQLVRDINAQGITVILTTHYMEEAEFLCNRVAIMDQGQILKIDEPQKLVAKIASTTQVSFLTSQKISEDLFSRIPDIEKIYNKRPKIVIEIKSLDNISKILKILTSNNIRFSGFTVKTASLEDVYLDLTGREFEE